MRVRHVMYCWSSALALTGLVVFLTGPLFTEKIYMVTMRSVLLPTILMLGGVALVTHEPMRSGFLAGVGLLLVATGAYMFVLHLMPP